MRSSFESRGPTARRRPQHLTGIRSATRGEPAGQKHGLILRTSKQGLKAQGLRGRSGTLFAKGPRREPVTAAVGLFPLNLLPICSSTDLRKLALEYRVKISCPRTTTPRQRAPAPPPLFLCISSEVVGSASQRVGERTLQHFRSPLRNRIPAIVLQMECRNRKLSPINTSVGYL